MVKNRMEVFKNQNYSKLRKHHQELGVPWTDPTFPPSDTSIGHSKKSELPRKVQWKRPHEITEHPRLFIDGVSSKDATQGRLGNCWFVAACSVLAGSRAMWEKVIPDPTDQDWDDEDSDSYSGIFRFRFWRFGSWVEVLVDDLLPFDEDNQLLFTHSTSNREFWTPLLEKAYAKLHGCYAVLDGGNLSDALVDFTSGVSEVVDLERERSALRSNDDKRRELFKTMEQEIEDHALMCCAIKATSAEEMEQRTDLGLVKGHAYGITAVRRVPVGGLNLKTLVKGREKIWLVRLQNPWGKMEWKGAFSDTSPEWSSISEKEREKLGLTCQDDGEFWMPFDDFLANFSEMSICRLINTSLFSFSKTWNETQFFGSWSIGSGRLDRAGGCLNHPDTFLNNPQYRFDVTKTVDEYKLKDRDTDETDDDLNDPENGTEIIIQLSQRDTRVIMDEPKENLVIGFHVLRCEVNRKFRLHSIIPQSSVATSDYIKTKHIFLRVFPKYSGRYLIIPTTFRPGETTDFLLRIFTEESSVKNILPVEKDFPTVAWWQRCCCIQKPVAVTRVTIKHADDLKKQDAFGTCDAYCRVRCERHKVRGPVVANTLNPKWKQFSLIFYRKKIEKPVKIQIWNKNLVFDSFVGQTIVAAPITGTDIVSEERALTGKGRKEVEAVPGKIFIEYQTFEDLMKI